MLSTKHQARIASQMGDSKTQEAVRPNGDHKETNRVYLNKSQHGQSKSSLEIPVLIAWGGPTGLSCHTCSHNSAVHLSVLAFSKSYTHQRASRNTTPCHRKIPGPPRRTQDPRYQPSHPRDLPPVQPRHQIHSLPRQSATRRVLSQLRD
jgi:hypothetical protein